MRIDLSRTEGRLTLLGLTAFGAVHVLVPDLLLRSARSAYGFALDVEFTPRERAPRRVRAVGILSLIATAIGWTALDRSNESRLEFERPSPTSRDRSADDH